MRKVMAFVLVFVAVISTASAGYLVSHEERVCVGPVAGPPGIGIAGFEYAETCPDGYSIIQPTPQEKPFWQKVLDAIDSWFGLSHKVAWIPTAKQLAMLTLLIAILRHGIGLSRWLNGPWTLVLSAVLSILLYVQGAVADGALSWYEAIAAVASTVAGAAGLWEALKRLIRR